MTELEALREGKQKHEEQEITGGERKRRKGVNSLNRADYMKYKASDEHTDASEYNDKNNCLKFSNIFADIKVIGCNSGIILCNI